MVNRNLKLGEMLLQAGIIDGFQLTSALSHQRTHGGRLGSSLIRLGYLAEERLLNFLADQLHCQRVDLRAVRIPQSVLRCIPEEKARKYNVIPVEKRGTPGSTTLLVAMADPTNLSVIDSLQFITGCRIRSAIATEGMIHEALDRCYGAEALPEAVVLAEEPETVAPSADQTMEAETSKDLSIVGVEEPVLVEPEGVTVATVSEAQAGLSAEQLSPEVAEAQPPQEVLVPTGEAGPGTEEKLSALLAKLHELGVFTRLEYEELAGGRVVTGTEPAAPEPGRRAEEMLRALLDKLHELGILTRLEYEELK